MSDNATAIRGTLTREKALAIVHKQLSPSDRQSGLCAVSPRAGDTITPGTSASKIVSTKDSTITYKGIVAKAKDTTISGNVMAGTGRISTTFEFFDGLFSMDLANIGYIGLEDNSRFGGQGKRGLARYSDQGTQRISVQHCPVGQLVLLYAGGLQYGQGSLSVWIHVAPENLDSLLAALSFLSPGVTMRRGTDTLGVR